MLLPVASQLLGFDGVTIKYLNEVCAPHAFASYFSWKFLQQFHQILMIHCCLIYQFDGIFSLLTSKLLKATFFDCYERNESEINISLMPSLVKTKHFFFSLQCLYFPWIIPLFLGVHDSLLPERLNNMNQTILLF